VILTHSDIFNRVVNKKGLDIQPWEKDRLQPISYELALSPRFLIFDPTVEVIDPLNLGNYTREINIDDNEQPYYDQGYLVLHPGEFVLGASVESITIPPDLVGVLNGKSSLGRLGLQIHATAGLFDPGFRGTATLEMSNISRLPIRLWPGMLVAQMVFWQTVQPVPYEFLYGSPGLHSHYQHQDGPTASRYNSGHRNLDDQIRSLDSVQLRLPGVQWEDYEESGKP
jgi:dCTP deaminase